MWLLQWCKLSKFLIIVTVSSAVVIVDSTRDSSARKRWTNQVNSTSTNESKTMQIVKDEFLSSTDGPLKSNRSTVDQERVYRNHESLYLQNESSRNFTKEVLSDAEVDSNAVWPYFNTGCLEWLPINHVYFQLANSFLFLSYFAPAGLKGLIFLRLMLAIGSAFLSIWGWIIICAFDTFLWNALFFVINAVHAVVLLISLRPVALDEQLEQVYRNLFKPLKVSKQQFKKVAKCVMSTRPIKRGEYFAVEQETAVETLSLLLSGIMLVIERGKTLYVLSPMQFLDSPDWFDDSCNHFYQESIQACEESRVLLWHRDKLQAILHKDLFLQSVFNQILGRDVVHKLSETSRNTNVIKVKRFSKIKGSIIDENGESPNGKPSENTLNDDQQAELELAQEQLSLLNETVAKNDSLTNNKREFSRQFIVTTLQH